MIQLFWTLGRGFLGRRPPSGLWLGVDVDRHSFAGAAVQKCRREGRWPGVNKTLFMDPLMLKFPIAFLARKYHY